MDNIVKRLMENKRILRENTNDRVNLKHIIDTWNMIEKYGIEDYEDHDSYISVSRDSYEKMLNNSKNKRYIMNLRLKEFTDSTSEDNSIRFSSSYSNRDIMDIIDDLGYADAVEIKGNTVYGDETTIKQLRSELFN